MDIVITADNNNEIMVMPVINYDTTVNCPSGNEEFETAEFGNITLKGVPGLRTVQISSIFPVEVKSWMKAGSVEASKYLEFFTSKRENKESVRLIMSRKDGSEIVNMSCTIESFNYKHDKVENIRYTLDLKEDRLGDV